MTLPPPIDWREAGLGIDADIPEDRRVTGANWRTWPFNRWAFQHTRRLVPSVPLAGADRPAPLPERPAGLSALRFAGENGEALDWETYVASTYTDAMIVLHRGVIVYETYRNGMTAATPHHLFSVTKSIVGLLAETLIAGGAVAADLATVEAVPELGASAFAGTTLRQLLDMTDGIGFDEDYANLDSDVHRYSASYWMPDVAKGGTLPALAALTRREAAPGTAFRYRTPIADAAAWVLRRATGRSLARLVAEHVWKPAGCGDPAHFLLDTGGHEIAGSGLNATARDLARLARFLMAGGPVAEALIAGGDRALFAAGAANMRPDHSYRGFWWVDHAPPPALMAMGVYGQRLHIEPESDLAIIRLASTPLPSNIASEPLHARAFAALRARLG
ncbi:serine hydrolase domain-containing protein [Sphingosinicella microcystinivorans]|uniref:serine hydrolase domain-containing protein n=1 Tax=Sphingosinicella microcystinivorans TaxID=335406 RepID=UPI0022F3D771|nr:serine hydrolase domain-containing protein [Sphingosinicella microcystinivorans]WBX85588.1 serine hydrolase [Sphingosinicella microcystinivorans]